MRTWLSVLGEHINLAAATSITELDRKSGYVGYTIYHGGKFTTVSVPREIETSVKVDRESGTYKMYRVIIIIRNFLYDRSLQDTCGYSDRSSDY